MIVDDSVLHVRVVGEKKWEEFGYDIVWMLTEFIFITYSVQQEELMYIPIYMQIVLKEVVEIVGDIKTL